MARVNVSLKSRKSWSSVAVSGGATSRLAVAEPPIFDDAGYLGEFVWNVPWLVSSLVFATVAAIVMVQTNLRITLIVFAPLASFSKRLIPLGVFLAAAGAVTFVWGEAMLSWYMTQIVGIPM